LKIGLIWAQKAKKAFKLGLFLAFFFKVFGLLAAEKVIF
jgi:hypothetical protein